MANTQNMYWLNIVLFSILDSESEDSNDYIIAKYLLENYNQLSGATLSEISEKCKVSKAAISRFCKKIGLLDYIDLQMLIRERHKKVRKRMSELTIEEQKEMYFDTLSISNNYLRTVMNDIMVEQLIRDLLSFDNIYIFGHLQASHIAYTFRTNLAILSKFCYCTQNWMVQKYKIDNATNKDLFIIFSTTGDYFKRIDININRLKSSKAKVYIITFEEGADVISDFINKIFIGKASEDPFSNILMNIFMNYVSFRLSHCVTANETR
ncbi:MurR/RpiR family transcriptional regulator [Faecalicoccus pleomorphus]|uniref:MurR/RpiR family transcriptional regulator n=1 Tax=Faecalicoccus pleomorphus TaxID=1323 RepID=A0A7X9NG50_9FIRM|nr:MurR/RpiR family transcriptional regulator [Faecalicoccus pleomorphus]NME43608.1 MurR/RpiR family transcriptional regulator [Faecalicoccus pleomorphus]